MGDAEVPVLVVDETEWETGGAPGLCSDLRGSQTSVV